MDILALLVTLSPVLSTTTVRHLSHIAQALLTSSGRVTMTGLARWGEAGGRYRTVQRFFATPLPWAQVTWLFVRTHLLAPGDVYLLAGDEVVVPKAGKKTHGVDRFFSSIVQKPLPGLAFFSLALVSTQARRAFPLRLQQVVRTAEEKAARTAQAAAKKTTSTAPKRPPGRPKGSTNKPKTAPLSAELGRIQTMVTAQLELMGGLVAVGYLLLDGHFGHSAALQMALACGLQLVSKLRADAALYLPYAGPYAGRGPRRKYGAKLNLAALPRELLVHTQVVAGVETCIYHGPLLHKEFTQPLNVVLIVKTNQTSGRVGHVILFSSDLSLGYEQLIDYYSLRFQIEFTFRDAKQYWGLDDFMNVTETGVTNAANLALFMVNLSAVLLADLRQREPEGSILDLKAYYRGCKYVTETIKMLPHPLDEDIVRQIIRQVTNLGRIHAGAPYPDAA